MAHLDENKLLSDRQQAFRKRHSCETQLITVINNWAKILDKGGQVDTFEKAFDTPHHELLKFKLYDYGIGGKTLKLIDSFLCFSQQRVVVNGVKSDWAPVFSDGPQGTVLGPLLFSLYINDVTDRNRDKAVCCRLCLLSRNQIYRGHCETSGGYRSSYLFGPHFDLYVFELTAYLKFAKLQYVSSGFRCRVITGSLMRLY